MGLKARLHDILEDRERRLAADVAVTLGEGTAAIFESLAEHHDHLGSAGDRLAAETYRDAADRARTIAMDLAEQIR